MSTPIAPTDLPTTLGTLRASNYQRKSIREELRLNLEQRLADGLPLTSYGPRLRGHRVLPQLETALLAGHDIILLGERGQAKSRMIRSLVELLDEWLPIVEGSETFVTTPSRRSRPTPLTWSKRGGRNADCLAAP
jgi:magnesium chelatase subunit I